MKQPKKINRMKTIIVTMIATFGFTGIGCKSFQPVKKESIPVQVNGGNP